MPHRDVPGLAALLDEPQRVLRAVVDDVLDLQPGDGADAGRRVEQDGRDGTVPQADHVRNVNRAEQRAGLVAADLGRLTLNNRVAFRPDRRGRVDDADVADDQAVEEAPQRGEVELLGRDGQGQVFEVFADVARADPRELQAVPLDPGEE